MAFIIQISYTVRIPIFWLVDLYHVTLVWRNNLLGVIIVVYTFCISFRENKQSFVLNIL